MNEQQATTIKVGNYAIKVERDDERLIAVIRPDGSELLKMSRHHTIHHIMQFIYDDQSR